MATLHILGNKTQISPRRLAGKVAIVIDVVFATTGIAIALERGAIDVIAAESPDAARERASSLPAGSVVLIGELGNQPIPGFLEPWPHLLARQDFTGKHVVYSSTNGTVALRLADRAGLLIAAALVNGAAVADYVVSHHAGRDIVLICAGSGEAFNLEDFYGAGYLVSLLTTAMPALTRTDSARAAWLLYERASSRECLIEGRAGRMMQSCGFDADLALSAQKSIYGTVPVCRAGRLTSS